MRTVRAVALMFLALTSLRAAAADTVITIPTRPGVTERMLVNAPAGAKAAVVLLAGSHGGLQIGEDGSMRWGAGNFLVRSRERFAAQGLVTVVVDAPSDRQRYPFLQDFRQASEHAADLRAVITWLRATYSVPVWLVGTSMGTLSAANAAIRLSPPEGADGIVLSSTILRYPKGRPVTAMDLEKIRVPVLVVHHEEDGCSLCPYRDVPELMQKLSNAPRKELLSFRGGNATGDPCEAWNHHGYNGIEEDVVAGIVKWILGAN